MAGYLLRRLAAAALLILIVLSFTFFFVHLAPGDPTLLFQDPRLGSEHRDALRRIYGLDRPLHEQYLVWLGSVVVRGDWGISFVHLKPVSRLIGERLPATLFLSGAALLLQYVVGLWAGITAARKAGSAGDQLLRIGSVALYSMPVFWTGLMALLLLSYRWSIFPAGHMRSVDAADFGSLARAADLGHHLILPALILAAATVGATLRFTRSSVLQTLGQDYIRTARAKGLDERRVLWVHALRNAATPLVQLLGLSLPSLLSGALVVEVVFSWPGLGRLTFDSILARDYPVVMAATALTGVLVVLGNLLSDLLHAVVDPRVRQ